MVDQQNVTTGNPDTRRLTILFLILREHRLLRELIAEVLLDKIKGFDYVVTPGDLRTFFEGKRDQNGRGRTKTPPAVLGVTNGQNIERGFVGCFGYELWS